MNDQIAGLEKQKKDYQALIEQRDLALKLLNNREFKKLILEQYCLHESARMVHQSADPVLKPEERADALNMAQAAGHLRRYISMVITVGDQAENTMPQLDDALEDARAEEDMPGDEDQTGTLN